MSESLSDRLHVKARLFGNKNCRPLMIEAANRIEHLERELEDIARRYEARSELYTDDAQCAANLADQARKALTQCTSCGRPVSSGVSGESDAD